MKSVACIMLARGREAMVARAVASFFRQDYERKRLMIWNTGIPLSIPHDLFALEQLAVVDSRETSSIGRLRNRANLSAIGIFDVDLYAHWDSDDWSHPRRLSEQVALIEHTGADLVGYRECVFWDSTKCEIEVDPTIPFGRGCVKGTVKSVGEAWIYRGRNPSWPIGSSFLYRREAFERFPFPDKSVGEDTEWLLRHPKLKTHAIPSTWQASGIPMEPRMICSIHSDNTSSKIVPSAVEWTREPRLDQYCREKMALGR